MKSIFEKCRKFADTKVLTVRPFLGVIATLVVLAIPVCFVTASVYANAANAALKEKNTNAALNKYKTASVVDPIEASYKLNYVAMLLNSNKSVTQETLQLADKQISKAEYLGKSDIRILTGLGSYYISTNNIEKGLEFYDRSTELRPLRPEEWQQKLNAYMVVVGNLFGKNDYNKAVQYLDKALALPEEAKKANEKNLMPFIFNSGTSEMLERMKYIKDFLYSKKKIDAEDIVFYSVNDMDIDANGIPDQWQVTNGTVAVKAANGALNVESTSGTNSFIRSRQLNLEPEEKYKVQVELSDATGLESLSYTITDVSKDLLVLNKSGNVFTGEISTNKDFKPGNNTFVLMVNGKRDIKGILIEKE